MMGAFGGICTDARCRCGVLEMFGVFGMVEVFTKFIKYPVLLDLCTSRRLGLWKVNMNAVFSGKAGHLGWGFVSI